MFRPTASGPSYRDDMGPAEFPTRDEFERLSEDEQFAHLEKLRKEIDDARTDTSRLLEVTKHWSDIAEWTLEPEEYERLVRMPAWNGLPASFGTR
jgi:hypothetical protein